MLSTSVYLNAVHLAIATLWSLYIHIPEEPRTGRLWSARRRCHTAFQAPIQRQPAWILVLFDAVWTGEQTPPGRRTSGPRWFRRPVGMTTRRRHWHLSTVMQPSQAPAVHCIPLNASGWNNSYTGRLFVVQCMIIQYVWAKEILFSCRSMRPF